MAVEVEPIRPALSSKPLVELKDVFKIYKEGTTETVALRGASMELPRGHTTSLVGPSGSGKSTLLSLVAGLALPSAGQVVVDGTDISRLGESERAQLRAERIGVVFQSGNLIPFLSAVENVELAMGIAGKRGGRTHARQVLSELGLGNRLHHRPTQLSGGEVQRVAVAVALANDPDLLLADELTGELDSATAAQVMTLLAKASRDRELTVLLVTHNRELAARADHRLHLVDGLVSVA
ncbi:MAG TPA: ABC transporter ATP-binding protein [Candidatus Dormibacteraeota bacterium]|nr:ABC transporter ATP-binding protein [Candidatus Dormibacteraeota bacterium]